MSCRVKWQASQPLSNAAKSRLAGRLESRSGNFSVAHQKTGEEAENVKREAGGSFCAMVRITSSCDSSFSIDA